MTPDKSPPSALDVLTPDEIASRITASSGVHMTGRTVWEKARRLGIAKKLGRSMFISINDLPALLEIEKPRHEMTASAYSLGLSKKSMAC